MNKKGLTFSELLVVMAIFAVVPSAVFSQAKAASKKTCCLFTRHQILLAQMRLNFNVFENKRRAGSSPADFDNSRLDNVDFGSPLLSIHFSRGRLQTSQ